MPSDYSTGDSLRATPASTSASPMRVSPISPLLKTPAVNATKHERPPTPESPSPSPALSHKRRSSQHDRTHDDDEHQVPKRRQDSYDFAGIRTCICMPEAKIPRPRNAFILYRQHFQAGILAKNPALTNPEISKIVGEQWNSQPIEVKEHWKKLAEEEAARHLKQYPGYRYQPKRPGSRRASTIESPTASSPMGRCTKCGGFSGADPTTPISSRSQRHNIMTPTSAVNTVPPNSLTVPTQHNGHLSTSPSCVSGASLESQHSTAASVRTSIHKRRRYDAESDKYGSPTTSTPVITAFSPSAQSFRNNFSPAEPPPRYMLPMPQPPPSATLPPPTHMMGPPPRPSVPYQPQVAPESSRMPIRGPMLPPLKIRDDGIMRHARAGSSSTSPSPQRMLPMNFLGKLAILSRISPPLSLGKIPSPLPLTTVSALSSADAPPQSPTSASTRRGAIVAVEGDNQEAVSQAVEWLGQFLCRDNEYRVRTAQGPKPLDEGAEVGIVDYLDLVRDWHGKSGEMSAFVTCPTPSPAFTAGTTADGVTPSIEDRKHSTNTDTAVSTSSRQPSIDGDDTSTVAGAQHIPIIILSRYQLHAANTYAAAIPVSGAYSPVDHWQWMATLWRGTVGADMTVYIKQYDGEDPGAQQHPLQPPQNPSHSHHPNTNPQQHPQHQNQQQPGATVAAQQQQQRNWREIVGKNKGVEVREERGLVIVWVKKGANKVEEGALRRVAFEIGEGARGVWEGRGVGK